MKTTVVIGTTIAIACVVGVLVCGSSTNKLEEGVMRIGDAANALRGEVGSPSSEPRIVREQQRKERIRQDTKWTAENQALHPIEYCQAQLDELDHFSSQLEVQLHEYATMRSSTQRIRSNEDGRLSNVREFLAKIKKAYRNADETGSWPIEIAGFRLSQDRAKDKIVEAAQRIPIHEQNVCKAKANLDRIERKIDSVIAAQRRVVEARARIESTIIDIRTRKAIDGEKGISDALNAINDSIVSLGGEMDDPNLEEIMTPSRSESRDAEFQKIMTE